MSKSVGKKSRFTLEQRRAVAGYLFIAPFIIGFLLFFLGPLIQSIIYSFNDVRISATGFILENVGFGNYNKIWNVDPDFRRVFLETIGQTLTSIPAILIFSFFAASLLNQSFRGRGLARVIFFLPVILSAGILVRMGQSEVAMTGMNFRADAFSLESGMAIRQLLSQLRMPDGFIEYITSAVDRVPEIINASAIPILILLAGLQGIPSSLYEAADIEGATAWENFWNITFVLISPLFITTVVYVTVDSFTSEANPLVVLIGETFRGKADYGASVAMSMLYFAAVAVILAIVVGILSKIVFYME